MYNKNVKTIVSLMCPDYAIEVPNGDCDSAAGLHLSNESYTSNDGRNQWSFHGSTNIIESVKCAGMFVTIGDALIGGEAPPTETRVLSVEI